MRSVEIDKYIDKLRAMWQICPEQRFGQLISNLFEEVMRKTLYRDIFFMNDEDLFALMEGIILNWKGES